jgi:hypothetical protein
MLILGLLLLAGAGVFTGLVIADNTSGGPEYNVSVLGHSIATMNTLEIFCAGLALALIFCLGMAMAMAGGVSRRHKSRKLAEARRAAAENARERVRPGHPRRLRPRHRERSRLRRGSGRRAFGRRQPPRAGRPAAAPPRASSLRPLTAAARVRVTHRDSGRGTATRPGNGRFRGAR